MVPRTIPVIVSLVLGCAGCSTTHPGVTTVTRPGKVLSPAIRPIQKWNPLWSLGNADDPEPPAWYRPESPNRRALWQMRNPFHNFTHYVAGVSDKPTTRTGRYPSDVFAPGGGWNWAFVRHRIVPLPFISFDGELCRFYLGWRESGNLGVKMNFRKSRRDDAPPGAPPVPPPTPATHAKRDIFDGAGRAAGKVTQAFQPAPGWAAQAPRESKSP